MRVLCLDLGEKRIGIAVSDELGLTAQGVSVLERKGLRQDIEAVAGFASQYEAGNVVVGLPRNMDGSYGPAANKARRFAQAFEEATGIKTELFDERMTTAIASRVLIERDMSRQERKRTVDKVAAQVILQSYLDTMRQRQS